MAEIKVEKSTCENCGASVRESTHFCYNCGEEFTGTGVESNGGPHSIIFNEGSEALDDLARKLQADPFEDNKPVHARSERKRRRADARILEAVVWDPIDEGRARLFLLIALLIFVVVAAIVFLAVYWK